MAPIELVPAELAGTVVETLLFGVFLVTFAMCMHVLFSLRYRQTSKLSVLISPMTIAALFLFASIVSHWILVIVRLFDAFIYGQNGNPLLFFANIRDGKNVVKTALYIAQALCADMIMVYRLFHVSNRSWAISVFPIATIISTAISGAGVTYQFVHLKPGTDIFNSECGRWIATAFSSTLLTNIYSTSLIAYRTWKAHNLVKSYRHGPSAMTVVHVIVESAAIYTACTLVTFVAYLAHSDLQFPSLDASSPVIGIVFCLIIVRIRLFGHTRFQAAGNSTFRSIPAGGVTSRTDGDGIKMVKTLRHSRTEPLVVSVHREVEVDISGEWMPVDTPAEKTEHESFS